MATDYRAKWNQLRGAAAMATDLKRGRELYATYGPWLRRYHGGVPAGVMAANMLYESNGNATVVGDQSLGEYGLFQVTKYFPPSVGLPAESRYDAQTNVFLGGLEYQVNAAKMVARYGLPKSSVAAWKMARLVFSIGEHGTTDLAGKAIAASSPGATVFDKVRAYVDATGGVAYGTSQPADKVWFRVHFVDHVFELGQKISPGSYGPPQVIPSPPGVRYSFPKSLLPFTGRPGIGTGALVVLALAAGAAASLLRRT